MWMDPEDIMLIPKLQMLCDSTQMWSLAVELDTRVKGREGNVIDCSVATGFHFRVLGRVLVVMVVQQCGVAYGCQTEIEQ